MNIGVLKEPEGENRVSILPEIVKTLTGTGNSIIVESGAGHRAFQSDDKYTEAGAAIGNRDEVIAKSELVLHIQPFDDATLSKLKEGQMVMGVYQPLNDPEYLDKLANKKLTVFSLDTIPRITRAQAMDVLSSMSTVSGYKAVLIAASKLPRFFPMLTTAAGTIAPAKVLILGAGVAGLQAIATAKRLGAVVEAFDTRSTTKEQVESLGGKFVEVEGAVEDAAAGGYAVEQSEAFKQKQKQAIADHVQKSDIVISTALIPGRKAPILITKEMVDNMKPGSVIVDLASVNGGNCELTEDEKTVEYNNISIIGSSTLPSSTPDDASKMYGKNVLNFLNLLVKEGSLNLDFEDEIINGTCNAHEGAIRHQPTLEKLNKA